LRREVRERKMGKGGVGKREMENKWGDILMPTIQLKRQTISGERRLTEKPHKIGKKKKPAVTNLGRNYPSKRCWDSQVGAKYAEQYHKVRTTARCLERRSVAKK